MARPVTAECYAVAETQMSGSHRLTKGTPTPQRVNFTVCAVQLLKADVVRKTSCRWIGFSAANNHPFRSRYLSNPQFDRLQQSSGRFGPYLDIMGRPDDGHLGVLVVHRRKLADPKSSQRQRFAGRQAAVACKRINLYRQHNFTDPATPPQGLLRQLNTTSESGARGR